MLGNGLESHETTNYLDNHFHEVFLRDDVLAADDLLQNARENIRGVHLEIHAVELAETDEVCADEDTEVLAFDLALLSVA